MRKIVTAALAAVIAWSAPASAQTMLLVIGERPTAPSSDSSVVTLEQKIETALDHACEKPFIRDLKGWALYKECRTEVRGEIEDQLGGGGDTATITVALR